MFRTGVMLMVALLLHTGCGGSKPLAEKVTPIGLVPLVSENLAPEAQVINRELVKALHSSGSFQVHWLQHNPEFWDLSRFQSYPDTSLRWVLTGRIRYEREEVASGRLLPLLVYHPGSRIRVQLEYRLYDRAKKGWKTIETLSQSVEQKGDLQILGFDPNDPSLAISATERARLRRQAYGRLFAQLIQHLEKQMEIKR